MRTQRLFSIEKIIILMNDKNGWNTTFQNVMLYIDIRFNTIFF